MPKPNELQTATRPSRRDFLRTSTTMIPAVMAGSLAISRSAHAAGDDTLRVGLVGCGSRGSGAAVNALNADRGAKLVAMADAFGDRLQNSRARLKKMKPDQVAVDDGHCFDGFDGYEKLIASGVDVVLLASPPHFRPKHLKACVDAGKHVFAEKPVGVDATGVRSVLATCEEAKKKGLSLVSGLCWRYNPGIRETIKRVHDGAIGDIVAMQATANRCPVWHRGRKPEWTEMDFQIRNWYYFIWLSGDFNVEQHVHGLDKMSWAMHDEPPASAWALSGRQVRTDPKYGDIFDHHAVVYEYANGVRMYAFTRQQSGCYNEYSEILLGTKGRCDLQKHVIEGETNWRHKTKRHWPRESGRGMHQIEQDELFASIRAGKPINNGHYMCQSTLIGILGRMVGYTGQEITWDEIVSSKQDLSPERYAWDADPPTLPDKNGKYPVAVPGVTKFV